MINHSLCYNKLKSTVKEKLCIKPTDVYGVNNPIIKLDTEDQVRWTFNSSGTKEVWEDVIVPCELAIQGYNIESDVEYYYKTKIFVPNDYEDNHIILRFDGVYSKARIWINENYIMEHKGGFTSWDCDITEYVKAGEEFELKVGVTDLSSDISYASQYAHHNIGGILRSAYLMAIPKKNINYVYLNTDFNDDYTKGLLSINARIDKGQEEVEDIQFKCSLYDKHEQLILSENYNANKNNNYIISEMLSIKEPSKWDAEHPNLYTLCLEISEDSKYIERVSYDIGFRKIEFKGNTTDSQKDRNKIYVNGQQVKLRGVNRHSISQYGRVSSPQMDENDAKVFKELNVNYVRTCHYPPTEAFLEACDKYGIYVEEETAVCWYGRASTDTEWYLKQLSEMVKRDYNHTSILIWSIANESDYHEDFEFGENFIKGMDMSRPVKVSWGNYFAKSKNIDVISMHYAKYNGELGNSDLPVIHDEYAHVSCYNVEDLKRDPNVRNHWGNSIKEFWSNIFDTDGALGGAVWAGIDDVFLLNEDITSKWAGLWDQDLGNAAGYGEWGCIFDIYRRLKPEAWHVKKAYSPIYIEDNILCADYISDEFIQIPVYNRFNHTNLNEITLEYSINHNEKISKMCDSVTPFQKGFLKIPFHNMKTGDVLYLAFYDCYNNKIDEYALKYDETRKIFYDREENNINNNLEIDEIDAEYIISLGETKIIVSKKHGKIERIISGTEVLVNGEQQLHVYSNDILLDKWNLSQLEVNKNSNNIVVVANGNYTTNKGNIYVEFKTVIEDVGNINCEYNITKCEFEDIKYKEIGMIFQLPSHITAIDWDRNSLWSVYPKTHIGRNSGIAHREREGDVDRYGVLPSWDHKDDMHSFFLFKNDETILDGKATKDYRSTKENINYCTLYYKNSDKKLLIVAKNKTTSVRLSPIFDRSKGVIEYNGEWRDTEFGHVTKTIGSHAEYTFTGTGVKVLGTKQINTSFMKVFIDEVFQCEINTKSYNREKFVPLYSISNLKHGLHTIKIEFSKAVDEVSEQSCLILNKFVTLQDNEALNKNNVVINNFLSYQEDIDWGNCHIQIREIKENTKGGFCFRVIK